MGTKAEQLKHFCARTFVRKGANGERLRLFESLDHLKQNGLLSEAILAEGELPILGCYDRTDSWLLVSTDRLSWTADSERHDIPIEAVLGMRFGALDKRDWILNGKKPFESLKISINIRQVFEIAVEPGPPLFGLWAVLNVAGGMKLRKAKSMGKIRT